jgi:hypothetical protein
MDDAAGSVSRDEEDLARFGYRQELKRTLGGFSSFAVAFSYISPSTGIFTLFALGWTKYLAGKTQDHAHRGHLLHARAAAEADPPGRTGRRSARRRGCVGADPDITRGRGAGGGSPSYRPELGL